MKWLILSLSGKSSEKMYLAKLSIIRRKVYQSVFFISCLFMLHSIVACSTHGEQKNEITTMPQQCITDCLSDYGVVLGKSPAGIPAYSNCNSACVVFEPNHINDIYTGIKWQCVEYARRWLLHENRVVFGDVNIAADIWALPHVKNPFSRELFKFMSIVNGAVDSPRRGDLLIYSKEYLGTGHVAVVTAVNEMQQTVQVSEQNYANTLWEDSFAREIKFTKKKNKIWLLDPYLIGWKRIE